VQDEHWQAEKTDICLTTKVMKIIRNGEELTKKNQVYSGQDTLRRK
jgi:hypothetical protein